MYSSPWQEAYTLDPTRPFTASRGTCRCAITFLYITQQSLSCWPQPGWSWSCSGTPQWHFFLAQSQHVATYVHWCFIRSQDIQLHDELVHDTNDQHKIFKVHHSRARSSSTSFTIGMVSLDGICRTYNRLGFLSGYSAMVSVLATVKRCNSVDGQMAWLVHIWPSAIRLSPLLLASRLGVRQEVEGDNPGGHFFTPSLNSFPESWIISYSLCQQSLQRQPLLAHCLQTTDFTTHCFNTNCLAWTSHFAGQYETKLSNWESSCYLKQLGAVPATSSWPLIIL